MEMLLLINLDMKLNWCGQDKNNCVRVSQGGGVAQNIWYISFMVIMSKIDLGTDLVQFQ